MQIAMEGTLLSVETPVLEIKVDNDTLRVTNKRLILNEKFIGIHELRGATVTVTPVTIGDNNGGDYAVTKSWTIIVVTLIISICGYNMMHPYNFVGYFAVFAVGLIGATVFGTLLAAPIHLLLKAKSAIASKTMDMTWLVVEKTDNSYFINKYYSLEQLSQLKKLESELNTLIFK